MKKYISKIMAVSLAFVLCTGVFTGCGNSKANTDNITEESKEENTETAVADKSEMAEPAELSDENLTPVYAEELNDGEYSIKVDSSSSMFNITECTLAVKDGEMTAKMIMGGTGYLKLFMGTGETAVTADESLFIPFEELDDGRHAFSVPVEALDKCIDCTAFSKNKEKWYDRVLVFRADTLSADAFKNNVTTESLKLADGVYSADVTLEGGSGKAHIKSPAKLEVKDGNAVLQVVWSSENYDYMKLDGERYDVITTEGGSTFEIPVNVFDRNFSVIADTVAMSTPHEIEYSICIDSASLAEM